MSEGVRVVAGSVIVSDAMAAAQSGEDTLEATVREHARLVYRIAYSVLRNHHDAEDATQETFVKVLRYGRKFEGVHDRKNWLARIAWRVAVDRRRKRPEVRLDEMRKPVDHLRSAIAAPEDLVITAEMTELLGRLIAGLPGELRDAVTLSTMQEMTPQDVAQVLEISEAAVRSRLFRARQILKERMTALLEGKHGT
jgi:RNA polymerase sigma-70 factor (ECF subfamily)